MALNQLEVSLWMKSHFALTGMAIMRVTRMGKKTLSPFIAAGFTVNTSIVSVSLFAKLYHSCSSSRICLPNALLTDQPYFRNDYFLYAIILALMWMLVPVGHFCILVTVKRSQVKCKRAASNSQFFHQIISLSTFCCF